MKLVYETKYEGTGCNLCELIAKKDRKIEKMTDDLERWQEQGIFPTTVEKTKADVMSLYECISRLQEEHRCILEAFNCHPSSKMI